MSENPLTGLPEEDGEGGVSESLDQDRATALAGAGRVEEAREERARQEGRPVDDDTRGRDEWADADRDRDDRDREHVRDDRDLDRDRDANLDRDRDLDRDRNLDRDTNLDRDQGSVRGDGATRLDESERR